MAQQENPDRQPGLWTEVGPGPVEEGWGSEEGEKEGREVERLYFSNPSLSPTSCGPRK